ncbi:MAG: hypothetical protein IBJ12_01370 [Sphingomonadaceae bacterium]|nr:hypothetical protein [Sphingomonadaceae bacterium]
MSSDTEKIELQKKARGQRPEYFADPAIDKVLSITMALAGETAVMRDRLDTIERLLASGRPVSKESVDAYQPNENVRAERDAWRDEFLDVVFRIVHQEREELAKRAAEARPYQEAIDLVEKS